MSQQLRAKICQEALEWIGTPYRYRQCVKGEAADCVNLPFGVAQWLQLPLPFAEIPYYSKQWAWHLSDERLLTFLYEHHFVERPLSQREAGDLLVMRIAPDMPCSHMAILLPDDWLVHAINSDTEGRSMIRRVIRQKLHGRRLQQLEACFLFPGVEP